MKEISVTELKSRMDRGDNIQVIDVREQMEYEICNIGAELIPMGEIMSKLDKISREKDVVVHCRSGGRSGAIISALESKGFTNLYNLTGGILAWADQVDPSMTKY